MARCPRRRHELLVRTGRPGKDYGQETQQGKPPLVFLGYRKPRTRDFTEAGLELAEDLELRALLRPWPEPPIQPPKLTRLPFTDFPQAPDNEPSTKPPLLRDSTNAKKARQQNQTSFTF